jgi:lipopolysaccharide export LptBFGC system permease protein LptF
MVYKTLHWYIFRELLRIFLMTASALTTLLAFGGTFKPLTRQGIEIAQLLSLIMNLMPAMLAYAIPIAALFAAVLVYWRLSTDNEITACRASGISFVAVVMPALFLGLLVASVDLVFVNYVVPVFVQRTERAIISDLGSLITSQINQSEKFEFGKYIVYADAARQEPSPLPNTSQVILNGMAVLKTNKSKGKPDAIVVARQAVLTITNQVDGSGAEITIQLTDATAFDPTTFKKVSGSIPELNEGGHPIPVPSLLRSKPKFLNVRELFRYDDNPTYFRPVKEVIDKIEDKYDYQVVAGRLFDEWKDRSAAGDPISFYTASNEGAGKDLVRIFAPHAALDAEKQLVLTETPGHPVRVDTYQGKVLHMTYTCGAVDVRLASDNYSGAGMTGSLQLREHVLRSDHVRNIGPDVSGTVLLPDLVLSTALTTVPPVAPITLLKDARASDVKSMRILAGEASDQINKLFQAIKSELHSRGSFSLSCLTLVLLGAALGLLMRGYNPLAVFVVGFVPALMMVLLITAGREMAEGSSKMAHTGIALIWAGNVVLLAMVAAVYAKLLRQ